ncbi:LysR substrate-binding domain-containing protein [Streptomyces sp. NPDC051567]|uniref:LysR substrate-binding domain-containing protein n=1 Tax=Streptomyces sp. NPDC051567 TaxID=3365660 RepID=UPI0037B8B4C4
MLPPPSATARGLPQRRPAPAAARAGAARGPPPRATVTAGGDATALTMAGRGLGTAILPELSRREAGTAVQVMDLGPQRPVRRVGYVTTPEAAGTLAVRALIREFRAGTS